MFAQDLHNSADVLRATKSVNYYYINITSVLEGLKLKIVKLFCFSIALGSIDLEG